MTDESTESDAVPYVSAFPVLTETQSGNISTWTPSGGLTMRDVFAIAIFTSASYVNRTMVSSRDAYRLADQLISAR